MSDNQSDNESEASLPTFRPFTREERAIIENRILEKALAAKKKAEKRAKNIAVSLLYQCYQASRLQQTRDTVFCLNIVLVLS